MNISKINYKLCDSRSWLGYSHTFINVYQSLLVNCQGFFSFGLGCKAFNETFKYSP